MMDNGILLLATSVSPLKREKRKKSSDDASTNGDPGASLLRRDVAWPNHIKNRVTTRRQTGTLVRSFSEVM